MKIGVRKPSIKKSIKARTTGKVKRTIKKSVNPLYGKKGMGYINNPKKAVYNKVYNKTTIDARPYSFASNSKKYNQKISQNKTIINHYAGNKENDIAKLDKPSSLEIIFTIMFGFLGLHKFLNRKYLQGILYLFSLGIFGIGWIYDIIKIFIRAFRYEIDRNAILKQTKYQNDSLNINNDLQSNIQTKTNVSEDDNIKDKKEDLIPKKEVKKSNDKTITFNVVGTSYKTAAIRKLGRKNEDYSYTKKEIIELDLCDEEIYQYDFPKCNVTFEDEPGNEHDPNALKVLFNDIHVGYIKKELVSRVRTIINDGYKKCYGQVYGGKYKIVETEFGYNEKDTYRIETYDDNFGCKIYFII